MLEALIPYFHAPEKTLVEHLPFIGPLKLQLFGPLVATGVIIGWRQCLKYAKKKDIDEFLFRDYLFWMLVSAFVISHLVSVIFYFPDQIAKDPTVLLQVWNGLSSVGGFFGAFIGMTWYLKKHKQPIIVYADATIYGLLVGWCFGRAGCSVVHDHPGKIVPEGTFLAVGPWPDGTWRYDLGLLEFMFALTLMLVVYFGIDVHKRRPGWLVGLVVTAYAPFRFVLDFFRADEAATRVISTPDERYAGLTPAQWFTIAFFLAGLWLLFGRKARPDDLAYAKDSDRIAREAKEAEKAAGKRPAEEEEEEDDDDDDDDDEAREAARGADRTAEPADEDDEDEDEDDEREPARDR
jgi:phosphatidylglycerol:prolipoprotein diacylglycerol transferase